MLATVSAYTYLWGQHDYNSQPFALLGCKVEAHIAPEIRETWAPHTATGYYMGNAHEHYRCHNIYITDKRSTHMCSSVFFKHKYLTMPTITPAEALIKAADNLTAAIAGKIPSSSTTTDAIAQLLQIFHRQADNSKNTASTQRVLMQRAQAQRVDTESGMEQHRPDTLANNTQLKTSQCNTTQECAHHLSEATPPLTAHQAASRTYSQQFIYNWAHPVLDNDTGNLLEYRHLIKHPKYRDIWSNSFGNKVRRLATTTETIAFMSKCDIPPER